MDEFYRRDKMSPEQQKLPGFSQFLNPIIWRSSEMHSLLIARSALGGRFPVSQRLLMRSRFFCRPDGQNQRAADFLLPTPAFAVFTGISPGARIRFTITPSRRYFCSAGLPLSSFTRILNVGCSPRFSKASLPTDTGRSPKTLRCRYAVSYRCFRSFQLKTRTWL